MTACQTCEHWRNPWTNWSDGPVDEVEEPSTWGTCTAISLHDPYDTPKAGPDVLAFTKDGSNYRADLHTRSDFGCVLWAASPPPSPATAPRPSTPSATPPVPR